jgi:hypothetical protein
VSETTHLVAHTTRELFIIAACLDVVLSVAPTIQDMLDPAERLSAGDLADIRALREKIGGEL